MEFKKLDKKVFYYWLSYAFIDAAISLIAIVILFLNYDKLRLALIITISLVLVFISILIFLYTIFAFKEYEYAYDEEKIIYKRGVIFKNKTLVPAVQIQDLHVIKGPILQLFKLSKLIISTGGSNYALGPIKDSEIDDLMLDLANNLKLRIAAHKED